MRSDPDLRYSKVSMRKQVRMHEQHGISISWRIVHTCPLPTTRVDLAK